MLLNLLLAIRQFGTVTFLRQESFWKATYGKFLSVRYTQSNCGYCGFI